MARVQLVKRPQRWDEPFGHACVPATLVDSILARSVFRDVDEKDFPDDLALRDIIANDARILKLARDEVVYSQGDFGSSFYLVLNGSVRRSSVPASRRVTKRGQTEERRSRFRALMATLRRGSNPDNSHAVAANGVEREFPKAQFRRNEIFGVVEALTRSARTATVTANAHETILLEIRWPGVRELLHWSDKFRDRIERLYRQRSLEIGLSESPLLAQLGNQTLRTIAGNCVFETHGSFDWTHRYQREVAAESGGAAIGAHEPIILEQDHYLDDLLLVRSGFARVTEKLDRGEKTLGYLSAGDAFGLTEIVESSYGARLQRSQRCLRAIGYADVIRVPVHLVKKFVVPTLPLGTLPDAMLVTQQPVGDQSLLDFSVDNRFVNGTMAMAIDTTRCVNCDDCVRACASTHNNIPRFIRHGPIHNNLMVAHACMHCADPVCLSDCPTGAIHRDATTGTVVIDEKNCIGCASCASACPYDNIRMEEVRNPDGAFQIDEDGTHILRATKCDLCSGQGSGPACQRACPHDALIRVDVGDLKTLSDWLDYAP